MRAIVTTIYFSCVGLVAFAMVLTTVPLKGVARLFHARRSAHARQS